MYTSRFQRKLNYIILVNLRFLKTGLQSTIQENMLRQARIANDWVIRKLIRCQNRADALRIERYIKSMKSRSFNEQLVADTTYFSNFKIIVKQRFNIDIE